MHDKLYLPGLQKLKRLIDSGFFGRILSVRGEFGYWVFEGDWQPAQRPSWNYRAEDGGGIIVDMFPHWNYVLENLFGEVKSVYAQASTHIADRWDEKGEHYTATAEDAAYGIFELEGGVDRADQLRLDRAREPRRARRVPGRRHARLGGRRACSARRSSPATPRPSRCGTPTSPTTTTTTPTGLRCPTNDVFQNGFRQQWEEFLVSYVEGTDYEFDLLAGARGVRLAEAGLQSSARGPQGRAARADAGLIAMTAPHAPRRRRARLDASR